MITLQKILDATRAESDARQKRYPLEMVQRKVQKMNPTRGFARALAQNPFSVIAEIKRKSPSMERINEFAIETALDVYHEHPTVSAISILTQFEYFGGTTDDLERARNRTGCKPKPLLRKDFILNEYEVYFSRWIGADAILLMANVLDKERLHALHELAVNIGLDVLCEVHDEDEITAIPRDARVCGINSRRFKGVKQSKSLVRKVQELVGAAPKHDTQTDLEAFSLFDRLPRNAIRVAESGVSSSNIEEVLRQYPFNAALIGTALLRGSRADTKKQLDEIQRAALASAVKSRRTTPISEPVLA
jgi:indole-3-glycerol phosphate synthase